MTRTMAGIRLLALFRLFLILQNCIMDVLRLSWEVFSRQACDRSRVGKRIGLNGLGMMRVVTLQQ